MKNTFHSLLVVLLIFLQNRVVNAQQIAIDKAEAFIETRQYKKAIPILKQLSLFQNSEIWQYKMGCCYLKIKDFIRADSAFKLVKGIPEVEYYLKYGELKQILGQYDEAMVLFEKYQQEGGQNLIVVNRINSCKYAKDHQTITKWHIEQNLNFIKGIYTGGCYFKGSLWFGFKHLLAEDNLNIETRHNVYVTSGSTYFNKYIPNDDLFISKYYIGGISFSRTTNEVIYSIQDSEVSKTKEKKLTKHQISNEYLNTLNMHLGVFDGKSITSVESFQFNSKEYSCIHPYIVDSGHICYFSSDMPGGHGGFDIYKIEKVNNQWSTTPINLGNEINTLGDEMYPYEYHDTILLFSSDGLLGYGGADIFKCNVFNHKISKPTNLGLPVNSTYDDFGISFITHNTGYFFSNRNSEAGTDALFNFDFPLEINYDTAIGIVVDELTLEPISNAKIVILGPDSSTTTYETDSKGRFVFDKMIPYKTYNVLAQKNMYHDKDTNITSNEGGCIRIEMGLDPILSVNTIYTLNDILFEYRKYQLTPEDLIILNRVAIVMLKNPNTTYELSAHTDARGADDENIVLSQNRAQSTVYYLLSRGVETHQLVATGYGEKKLKNRCSNGVECSEEEHHLNRRVEIKVLSVK